ncbi:serine hydrolase [Synechococcus sp. MU1650]|uniref:serine hydrolase domain-containing protein n=1 Tax=Synechococcus sp. MU1650 TaxID=2508352 RepID=UPI001CF8F4B6|nr:serine hydrolase domain-containing protein [Synechococcus sp. MU1650]MCB4378501.1 beta-lactamase family protein [Synechococcus sp. MU1650]
MTKRSITSTAFLIAGLIAGPIPAGMSAEATEAEINKVLPRAELQTWMEEARVPGVSISVIKDFKIHWSRAFGVADAATSRPVTPETRFQAASISKPVMAVAAAVLADRGQLDLDADVGQSLHSWELPRLVKSGSQPITPRMLLSHTSGLDDGLGFPGYEPSEARPDALAILTGRPPAKTPAIVARQAPMTKSRYSGGGSVVMQVLLMDATGKPFPELMQSLVLKPLGMGKSIYQQPLSTKLNADTALAHDNKGRRFNVPWKVYPALAAAGLWSTPTDLALLVSSLQKTKAGQDIKPFTKASASELLSPVGIGSFSAGFNVFQQGEGWYFAHLGANQGYRSFLIGHIAKGYGLVVMTNSDGGFPLIERICRRIQIAYDWDVLETNGEFRFGPQRGLGCLPT